MRGEETLTYTGVVTSFVVGSEITGEESLARAQIASDTGSDMIITNIRGQFRVGEIFRGVGSGEATVSSVTPIDGFYFRMRSDRDLVPRKSQPYEDHRGVLEMATPDHRVMFFDDEDERIRIHAPDAAGNLDTNFIEINTFSDFIRAETTNDYHLIIDDQQQFIDLATPGSGGAALGYRLRMDEAGKFIVIKGDAERYFFHLNDLGSREVSLKGPYPGGIQCGVILEDFYVPGQSQGTVTVFANNNNGRNRNGIFWDRGNVGISRPEAVYFYDNSRSAPSNHIRLVSTPLGAPGVESGQVDIGQSTAFGTSIKLVPNKDAVMFAARDAYLTGSTKVFIDGAFGLGADDTIQLKGKFVSHYFKHIHEIPFAIGQAGAAGSNALISLTLAGTWPFAPGSTTTPVSGLTLQLASAPFLTVPPVDKE